MLLKDKNIVITGSSRGIGKHVAIACAKNGANVGITSRSIDELNQVKEEIKNVNPDIKCVLKTADVTEYSQVEQLFSFFHEELGELHGVIANAGASGRWKTHEFESEKFSQILDVNILGVFHTFKATYQFMKKDDKKDKARFIITGSATYPAAMPMFAAYTASKYGVVGFQRALALEYKRENITFNMILPTMVDTVLLRGDKAGDGNAPPNVMHPSELTEYFVFLLTKEANRVSDELIYTNEFEQYRSLLEEIDEEYKQDWDTLKSYLEENEPKIYDNIRKQRRLAQFFL
ncbi:MAG: SDR family NAD(P)-dependent oxidoreductase [Candidatus Lokiarchaeota archaeon]|nr:SDR family NAD(P)-dependent oxidoreductase [Candidatus Lokiarchaeota archaeon]